MGRNSIVEIAFGNVANKLHEVREVLEHKKQTKTVEKMYIFVSENARIV